MSDSESENDITSSADKNNSNSNLDIMKNDDDDTIINTSRKKMAIILSDDENDISEKEIDDNKNVSKEDNSDNDDYLETKQNDISKKKRRLLILNDSDDENDSEVQEKNDNEIKEDNLDSGINEIRNKEDSDSENDHLENNLLRRRLLNFDSDEESLEENIKKNIASDDEELNKESKTYVYNKNIYDTEISDDEPAAPYRNESPMHSDGENNSSEEENIKSKKLQKSFKKNAKKKSKVDILKEKQAQKMEIYSESQKMIRESEVYLPYHQPKQRSIMDFLNRKKPTVYTSNKRRSLKMSMKDERLLREIEERKKEVDSFYKSDSEDESRNEDLEGDESLKNQPENDNFKKYIIESLLNKPQNVKNKDFIMHNEDAMVIEKDMDIAEKDLQINNSGEIIISDSEKIFKEINLDNKVSQDNQEKLSDKENNTDLLDKESNDIIDSLNKESNDIIDSLNKESNDIIDSLNKESNDIIDSLNKDSNNIIYSLDKDSNGIIVSLNKDSNVCDDSSCLKDSEISGLLDDTENFKLQLDTEDTEDMLSITKVDEANDKANSEEDKGSLDFSQELKNIIDNKEDISNITVTPKLNLLASRFPELDLKKIASVTPKIGNDFRGDYIDLDDFDKTPKLHEGASLLLDRFVKHSNTKKKPAEAQKVTLNVVSKEKNESGEVNLVSSSVLVNLEAEEEIKDVVPVPGARLSLVKNVLRAQLLQKREKERQRREKEKQFLDSEEVIKDFDDVLPDEEAEMSNNTDTEYETESEPEENDIIITDKKRKKNRYVEEEAEESDDNENDEVNGLNDDINMSDSNDEDSIGGLNISKKNPKKIIEDDDENATLGVTYDYDEPENLKLRWTESTKNNDANSTLYRTSTEDLFSNSQAEETFRHKKVDRANTQMDASFELVGSMIPGHQPRGGLFGSQNGDSFVEEEEEMGPLTLFSKVDNLKKSCSTEEGDTSRGDLSFTLTPLKDSQFTSYDKVTKGSDCFDSASRKLLMTENDKSEDKQELLWLCSGKFTGENNTTSKVDDLCNSEDLPPTQDINDLIGLCSGHFKTQANLVSQKNNELKEDNELNEDNNELKEDTQENELNKDLLNETSNEAKKENLMNESSNHDSNKFSMDELSNDVREEYPTNQSSNGSEQTVALETQELDSKPEVVIASSDEEGILQRQNKSKKRRKRKRIVAMSDEEDVDSVDSLSDDEVEDEEMLPQKFTGFKYLDKGGIRPEFLDKEAELSGSEADSDDEEEPNEEEDFMEQEEGDLEKFDEEELRNEVGRAHMKSIIDSDKRELRLLQEMYLEDGDLHGQGRERKFRWKNTNGAISDDEKKSEDEIDEENIEEEAEWRKERYEREKFIREQKSPKEKGKTSTLLEDTTEVVKSSSLKLVRSKPLIPLQTFNSIPTQSSPLFSLSLSSKRGSFLKRDKTTLKKLADFTKENETVGGAKQGGNFVFQTLTAEEVQAKVKKEDKVSRKPPTQPLSKKCRLERSFFSMDSGSQNSSVFKYL